MAIRRAVLRLLTALVAAVYVGAPAVASLIDARPAALAMSERAVVHVEEPGVPHALGHTDECALCLLGTLLSVAPPPTPIFAEAVLAAWPPRRAWLARADAWNESALRSRAPPV